MDGDRVSRYGWDTGSFFYPGRDRSTLLLFLAGVLFLLHFDELFGLHTSTALVGGVLPAEFAYQLLWVGMNIGFAALLYRYWPHPDGGTEDG